VTETFGNHVVFAVPQRDVKSISKTFSLLEQCKNAENKLDVQIRPSFHDVFG